MIHSMTAYANASLQKPWGLVKWEIKSVNHRYLELSFKLPERLRSLEPALRELIKNKLQRGKVECWLYLNLSDLEESLHYNPNLVKQLAQVCDEIMPFFTRNNEAASVTFSPLEILKWPDMIVMKDLNLDLIAEDILKTFKTAVLNLAENRAKEGTALSKIIVEQLRAILKLVEKIKEKGPEVVLAHREKLASRLSELHSEVNMERFEQEVIYYLQKIDITEELDRLASHLEASLETLNKGGVLARHLDFLMQELNREANTLASKSSDLDIIQKTVEIRVLIEKIREQVQNLE